MELDIEPKGNGNSYTTEFRQYDPRLGRWLSLDPLMAQFPWMSPYVAFDNNPIYYTDPYGLSSMGLTVVETLTPGDDVTLNTVTTGEPSVNVFYLSIILEVGMLQPTKSILYFTV